MKTVIKFMHNLLSSLWNTQSFVLITFCIILLVLFFPILFPFYIFCANEIDSLESDLYSEKKSDVVNESDISLDSSIKCPYCSTRLVDSDSKCPNCGASDF